jgi:hypothetical protein
MDTPLTTNNEDLIEELALPEDHLKRFDMYKDIPDSLLNEVKGMNRAQKRFWCRKNKSRIKKELVEQTKEPDRS